ncbi:hypothetical protein [Microlunatus antarcticus]|uniref:DUF4062 domain-containing protein n=1 Tax=Microlunatus antarcticus TaxID=53388 RepID=A0A7W5P8T4_9ACTN|nr:hypothetical protein [Microlunatus antarcticus]MBB3328837.1 hypothetical protein [Microlunatus antarcticus]
MLKVLIASPGDTRALRDEAERALHEWNGDRAETSGAILLPRRWETNAVPLVTGTDGQSVINSQLVDDVDIVIGIFHATLGRPTPRAVSGTAEELAASSAAGKPVHVFFGSMPIPHDHDRDQLAALDAFKKEMSKQSLYSSYDTPGSLNQQIKSVIEYDLKVFDVANSTGTRAPRGASFRVNYVYDREPDARGKMTTRHERLHFVNDGDALAENLTFELDPGPDGSAPTTWGGDGPFTVAPNGGSFDVATITYAGVSDKVTLKLRWTEADETRESSQTVTFY